MAVHRHLHVLPVESIWVEPLLCMTDLNREVADPNTYCVNILEPHMQMKCLRLTTQKNVVLSNANLMSHILCCIISNACASSVPKPVTQPMLATATCHPNLSIQNLLACADMRTLQMVNIVHRGYSCIAICHTSSGTSRSGISTLRPCLVSMCQHACAGDEEVCRQMHLPSSLRSSA